MRDITIKVIPHSKQRYDTSGDYWIDKRGTIQVRISRSKNWRYEALVLIHELTEMFLCTDRRVSFKAIDRFDMKFEGDGEPGDDPKAPYYRQHRFATRIERLLAKELQVKPNSTSTTYASRPPFARLRYRVSGFDGFPAHTPLTSLSAAYYV